MTDSREFLSSSSSLVLLPSGAHRSQSPVATEPCPQHPPLSRQQTSVTATHKSHLLRRHFAVQKVSALQVEATTEQHGNNIYSPASLERTEQWNGEPRVQRTLACSTELLTHNHNDCRLARNRLIARRNLRSLIGNFRQRQIMAARSEESDLFLNKDPSIAALVIIYFLKYHSSLLERLPGSSSTKPSCPATLFTCLRGPSQSHPPAAT